MPPHENQRFSASNRRHADEVLPPDIWEEVARHIKPAADRARFCMIFKCLCEPASLKACFLLHLEERLKQERLHLVSLFRLPPGNLHPEPSCLVGKATYATVWILVPHGSLPTQTLVLPACCSLPLSTSA